MGVSTDLRLCSRSVLITFTVRVTKQHPVNISFLKNLVQRIIEAQSVLPSFNPYAPRTRTYSLFCDKTRLLMFYLLNYKLIPLPNLHALGPIAHVLPQQQVVQGAGPEEVVDLTEDLFDQFRVHCMLGQYAHKQIHL